MTTRNTLSEYTYKDVFQQYNYNMNTINEKIEFEVETSNADTQSIIQSDTIEISEDTKQEYLESDEELLEEKDYQLVGDRKRRPI